MVLTRTVDHEEEVVVDMPCDEAFEAVLDAYQTVGRVSLVQERFRRITGKVESGYFNMKIATVTVLVQPMGRERSKLSFKASAQAGLLQQNAPAKAVSRILEAI